MNDVRNIVVTGASAGIGRAIVRRLAKDGARLGLIARGTQRLEQAAQEVRDAGGEAVVLPADVADFGQLEAAAERFEAAFGPIDAWINNAMATVIGPVHEVTPDEFRRVTEVTYLGQVYGTMVALERMRSRDRGTIVQVGSALAYRSIPLQAAYCGAKHGIVGFTDSLRSELLHQKSRIRLTVVHPPGVNTPQFDWARSKMPRRLQPVPPIFQPELIADAVRFVLDHPRRELVVGRSAVMIVLAQMVAPGLLDRYLARTAWDGQMADEPVPADRPDNLYEAVEGDWAAHGRFDDRAQSAAPALWLAKHRALVAAVAVALFVLALVLYAAWGSP